MKKLDNRQNRSNLSSENQLYELPNSTNNSVKLYNEVEEENRNINQIASYKILKQENTKKHQNFSKIMNI